MKVKALPLLIGLFLSGTVASFAQPVIIVQPGDEPPNQQRMIWSTDPGIRYALQESTDVSDPASWTTVAGYPTEAEALAQQALIELDAPDQKFYRVRMLDEQPPLILQRYPAPDAFAIPRFADVRVVLGDTSGVDPSSLFFTLGTNAPVNIASPSLSFSSNVLTFITTDYALGNWGETVTVSVAAADINGNGNANTWSFRLEVEAVTTSNLFVFGSPSAKRAGQSVRGPAAALASRFPDFGPAKASGSAPEWSIQEVTSNTVVLAYTSVDVPSFAPGQLICNLAPTTVNEIFYRRVVGTETNELESLLILETEDIAITEFVAEGSVSFSENSVVFETAAKGILQTPLYIGGNLDFPPLTVNLSGGSAGLRDDGFTVQAGPLNGSVGTEPVWLSVDFNELAFNMDTDFQAGLDIGFSGLKSFHSSASGSAELDLDIGATVNAAGVRLDQSLGRISGPLWAIYLGQIGPVPVFGSLQLLAELELEAEAAAELSFGLLYRHDHELTLGMDWRKGQGMVWERSYNELFRETDGSAELNGRLSFGLALQPRLEFMLYAIAGWAAELEGKGGVEIASDASGAMLKASLNLTGEPVIRWADFSQEDESISLTLWSSSWPLSPPSPQTPLAFRIQPRDRTVKEGESATFSCEVAGASSPRYRWFHKGLEVPGQTGSAFILQRVTTGHAGEIRVRVESGGQVIESERVNLVVLKDQMDRANKFQYPIGTGSYITEFPPGGHNETNTLYPDNPVAKPSRADQSKASGWYNIQDVGSYYYNPGYNINGIHAGEDWNLGSDPADRGMPVYAVANGVVKDITSVNLIKPDRPIDTGGYAIVLRHFLQNDETVDSVYMHVAPDKISDEHGNRVNNTNGIMGTESDFTFREGAVVARGNIIAVIGNVVSYPDHLHFEMRTKPIENLPTPEHSSASQHYWDNGNVINGYYGSAQIGGDISYTEVANAFTIMEQDGIIDPSDFIDTNLFIQPPTPPAPSGMVLIPGGTNAGTDPDFGAYSLTVASFYMDRYEVTKALWDEVKNWNGGNGYSYDNAGSGKAANHPVHKVNWYDVVKWCNARSQKEGRIPVYYTDAGFTQVYKTGRVLEPYVKTSANGYRLPTDVEWEYAARGGVSGRRFPWGDTDTIQHARANYFSSSSYSYDTSPTRVFHPTYNTGETPYTSPVGSFAANGYGLYDMAGNVWEWVFDWHPSYVGSGRVFRGGSWTYHAHYCRVANRIGSTPDNSDFLGFRAVLPPGQ